MPDPIDPRDLGRLERLRRSDELSWEFGGDGPRATQMRAAGSFAAAVLEGQAIAFSDGGGATAFADTLLQAMEGPGKLPEVRLDLFGVSDDPLIEQLRTDALDVLVTGTIALARSGRDLDRLLPDLMRFAGDPTPDAIELRRLMLGDQPFGPEPRFPSDLLLRIRDFLDKTCYVGVLDALNKVGSWAAKANTDANGITALVPPNICPGATFSIRGSGFGASQPAGTSVLVPSVSGGWLIATVVSWSDSEIVVQAPPAIGPGCVGFLRGSGPHGPIPEDVVGELEHCFGPSAGRWDRLRDPKLSGDGPPCLPGGANRLTTAGAPKIHSFPASVNAVEPGGSFQLSWSVLNATNVSITQVSPAGPAVWLGTLSLSGNLTVGPFQGTKPVTATYRLVATNGCGQAERNVSISLRARPNLSIVGVEVVQSVQRADNSIRLVTGQRTAVRVFVDSGIRGGFDSGAGPNELAGLQVRVTARPMPAGFSVQCIGPWDASVHAKSSPSRDRRLDAFTFDVPVAACTGRVRFEVSATVAGRTDVLGSSTATSAVEIDFQPKDAQEVLPILITDSVNPNPVPTRPEYLALLGGARERQPFSDGGFKVNPELRWSTGSAVNLRTGDGWNLLLARILATGFLFPSTPVGGIRTAAVANDGLYRWDGLAFPRVGPFVPGCICRVSFLETFAHEIGHTYSLLHVNCGPAAGPYGGLPLNTDEPGVDVRNRVVTAAGSKELMSYCGPQWVSTMHWDHMFDRVPIS